MDFFKTIDWKGTAVLVVVFILALAIYQASGAESAITTMKAKTSKD